MAQLAASIEPSSKAPDGIYKTYHWQKDDLGSDNSSNQDQDKKKPLAKDASKATGTAMLTGNAVKAEKGL